MGPAKFSVSCASIAVVLVPRKSTVVSSPATSMGFSSVAFCGIGGIGCASGTDVYSVYCVPCSGVVCGIATSVPFWFTGKLRRALNFCAAAFSVLSKFFGSNMAWMAVEKCCTELCAKVMLVL